MPLAAAWACGNTGRQAAGRRCGLWAGALPPCAGGYREGGWVAWRTVPTLAAGALATLASALLVLCRGPARADSAVTDRVVRWCAAVWLRAAGARVVVEGLEHVEPAATYVVVSNHQSDLDPMAQLRALPLSVRALAMRELFQFPLFGRAMRTIGMIEVDRDSPDFRKIDDAAARDLAAGHSLLVYPEGTASPDGTIGEFKDGAFIIAVANQVPVLPAAICGTCRIWQPGSRAIRGGQVRIVIGRPLQTSRLTRHDIAGLRDQARDVIWSAHRDLVQTMAPKAAP
jgi:1-acyl-sn-glycerol-3-phosphate acyltransferase